MNEETILEGPVQCTDEKRCAGLQHAIDEDYLNVPIMLRPVSVTLRVGNPALYGPPLSPRSRKRKSRLFLNYCPFCGTKFKETP